MELAAVTPTLRRQHQVGETSARSLLLTVLGEFVLPRSEPVWTATFVDVLGLLGVEEKAARQALARTASDGWLASERVGRRVRWSLTAPGRTLLTEGAERIYSFGTSPPDWDGRWLVLLVSVPESRRELRHRLRAKLSWAGFGSPAPGVWICPHTDREAEAAGVLDQLGLSAQAMSYTAAFAGIGSEQSMVDRAWHLDEIGARYREFVAEFDRTAPGGGDAALLAQVRLVHEWRRFPLLDPRLPETLLPPRWAGARAVALFGERHRTWHGPAQSRWAERVGEQGVGGLARPTGRRGAGRARRA